MRSSRIAWFGILSLAFAGHLIAEDAFKINGKVTSVSELAKKDPGAFFKIEQEKYQMIEQSAAEAYLESYWQAEAKKSGKSVDAVQKEFNEKSGKVSDAEVNETLSKFKDHPELKKDSKEEQKKKITDYLRDRKMRTAMQDLIEKAKESKNLVVLYPMPKEPIYNVSIAKTDVIRYGAGDDDIQPQGCSDNCPITIVEYSEFQCPFCSRVVPTTKQLLQDYKGKIRWTTRDFPLDFHPRAKPAAIAAHCAGKQGKYWAMYRTLFANQTDLADKDFEKYAASIKGLDAKAWKQCVASPKDILKTIDENIASGSKYGVTGTPAFFINGRRLSGALPYDEFKRVIEDELRQAKKS